MHAATDRANFILLMVRRRRSAAVASYSSARSLNNIFHYLITVYILFRRGLEVGLEPLYIVYADKLPPPARVRILSTTTTTTIWCHYHHIPPRYVVDHFVREKYIL